MTAARREHTTSPLKAWVRALERTAPIGSDAEQTLPRLIEQLGERLGEAPALLSATESLSYHALAARCQRYARWGLSQGWAPGDVVALLMPNCPDYMAIWLGLTRIGVTVSLLNTHLNGALLAHSISIVTPRALVVAGSLCEAALGAREQVGSGIAWWAHGHGPQGLPRVDQLIETLPATPLSAAECAWPTLMQRALYIYTSGTTGLPKAANVSHLRVMQWSQWFAGLMDTQPTDRMYNCLPMYHSIGGVVATGAVLAGGGAVVLRERFSAREFWSDVVQQRCTLFQYIGELCRYLLHAAPDTAESSHELRLCCGNGLRAEVWEPFQRRFHIPQILEYYAATEGNFSLYNCEGRIGAIGRIPPFLSHRVRVALVRQDPASGQPLRDAAGRCVRCAHGEPGEALGEIAGGGVGDSGRFEGYADTQASEQKMLRDVFRAGDAWYRTGDLMRQDEQGFYYFVDRVGDSYRWKGENISATEVAATLATCAGVREAVAYGVAVPGAEGRAGMAALVLEAPFDPEAFRREVTALLPDYARPLFVRLVSSLELTGTFKQRKQQLSAQGYDPALVPDPLYFDDRARARYIAVDATLYRQLQAGQLRL